MKNIFIIGLFLLAGLFSVNAQNSFAISSEAISQQQNKNNYVVLTRKIPQLKPILLAAEEIKKEDRKNFGNFEIVVCGKTVQKMTDKKTIEPFIAQAKKLGLKIHACGFSLKKFGVKQEALPKGLDVVQNGIYFNLNLQRQGYKSIEL